ncbi:MAG: epoxyqueuosine reductase QueH [Oscillospiraceae bacterium]|nr:epoxyqueuosine reductase QueH [Oscillospiraceae bacterium]
MEPKRNYQRELDDIIKGLHQRVPTLLLHSCCAPCSSYVLEYLSQFFAITVFYYNPNIYPSEEYDRRVLEQQRLIGELSCVHPVSFVEGPYDTDRFYEMAKGMEALPEGGERCFSCYRLRLEQAAALAKAGGFDYFTTTLSISPHKNAQKLNEIGQELAEKYGVAHLPSDFKKKEGYKRSIELSREHHLYRQDYCGCVFSKAEAERRHRSQQGK